MATVLLPLLLAALPPSLEVVVAPGASDCDLATELHSALLRVLPEVEIIDRRASARRGALQLVATPDLGAVDVQLLYPNGEVRLARTVNMTPGACGVTADTVALIVERNLRDIDWQSGPTAEAVTPIELEAAEVGGTSPRVLGFGLEASGEVGPNPFRLRPGITLSSRAATRWLLVTARLGAYLPHSEAVLQETEEVGTYNVWSTFLTVGPEKCWPDSGPRVCGAAQAGAEFFFGSVEGERIESRRDRAFWLPLVMAQASYVHPLLNEQLALFAGVSAVGRLGAKDFVVEGASNVYAPSALAGLGSVGVQGFLF